jgi:hypothetical protein
MMVCKLEKLDAVVECDIFRELVHYHHVELGHLLERSDHKIVIEALHDFDDSLMLVTDGGLHHIENIIYW